MVGIHNYNELNGEIIDHYFKKYIISNIVNNINNLPITTLRLKLDCDRFNNYLDNISSKLYYLEIYLKQFNKKLHNLPLNLNILSIFYIKNLIAKLPVMLKDININDNYNEIINVLPFNLEILCIYNNYFNNIVNNVYFTKNIDNIPLKTSYISLDICNFNQIIDNLSNGVNELNIRGESFNQTLNNLPIFISKLRLKSNKFNKKLNKLPSLYLMTNYNKFHTLSNKIEHLLYHGEHKNLYLPNTIKNYEYTKTSSSPSHEHILNILPHSLRILKFTNFNYRDFNVLYNCLDNLPNLIYKISLYNTDNNHKINNLPLYLINLELQCYISSKTKLNKLSLLQYLFTNNKIEHIPNTIKTLKLLNSDIINLDFLHEGLETLKIYNCNKQINDLPSSIKQIKIKKSDINFINKIYHHKTIYF